MTMPSGYWWDGVTYTNRARGGMASTTMPWSSTGTPTTRSPWLRNTETAGG